MLSRPTTEQILLDCRRELLEVIAPAIAAPEAQIAVQMMENVLRNVATRAAHEIAWMRDEDESNLAFARDVLAAHPGADALRTAIDAYDTSPRHSLHLDDVVATYALGSACLGTALEVATGAGDDELHRRGRALLEHRLAHEQQIMGEWSMVGRA